MDQEQTLVYLPAALKKRAKHRAIDENISLSTLVERALENYLTPGKKPGERRTKMKKNFTSNDIIDGNDRADLGEFGSFVATGPVTVSEIPPHLKVEGKIDGKAVTLTVTLENGLPSGWQDMTAGELFMLPWEEFQF